MNSEAAGQKIFLSYASEDRDAAARIARGLENQGFSVWWDKDIPTGVDYPKFIEGALKSAGCVMVLWSHASTSSRWVRNEADWGAENNTLIPVLIESAEIPWEFRNIQTLDLATWTGDEHAEVFQRLMTGLKHLVPCSGEPPKVRQVPEAAPARQPAKKSGVTARRGGMIGAAGVLLVLVLLHFSGLAPWTGDDGGASRPAEEGIAYTPVNGGGNTRSSCLSPDGKYLVYTPVFDGRSGLILSQIDTGMERVLVEMDEQGIRSPVFSPDGVYIYFAMTAPEINMSITAISDLYRISQLGGNPQKLTEGIMARRFAVSPDGNRVAFKRAAGDSTLVVTMNTDGSGERTIFPDSRSLTVTCCLTWSRGGDAVVISRRDPESNHTVLVAIPSGGGEPRKVGKTDWQAVQDLLALPDGSGYLVVGTPVTEKMDLNSNVWIESETAGLKAVTDDITNYYQVSSNDAGDKLALTYYSAKRILRLVDLNEDGRGRNISTDVVARGRVAWAAPGKLVVNQQAGNSVRLVEVDLATRRNNNIPTKVEYVSELDVSDDGRQLAYTSFEGREDYVWVAGIDGSSPRRLTADGERETYPHFAPDGSWLVTNVKSAADQPWRIRRHSLTDGSFREIWDGPALGPRVSPDGSTIVAAFFDTDLGGYRLGTIPSGGGEPAYLDIDPKYEFLDWNPDGESLTCYLQGDGILTVCDVPLDGSVPRPVTELEVGSDKITGMAWNAAGDSLAVCLQSATFDVLLVEGNLNP